MKTLDIKDIYTDRELELLYQDGLHPLRTELISLYNRAIHYSDPAAVQIIISRYGVSFIPETEDITTPEVTKEYVENTFQMIAESIRSYLPEYQYKPSSIANRKNKYLRRKEELRQQEEILNTQKEKEKTEREYLESIKPTADPYYGRFFTEQSGKYTFNAELYLRTVPITYLRKIWSSRPKEYRNCFRYRTKDWTASTFVSSILKLPYWRDCVIDCLQNVKRHPMRTDLLNKIIDGDIEVTGK